MTSSDPVEIRVLWSDGGLLNGVAVQKLVRGCSVSCADEKRGEWVLKGDTTAVGHVLLMMAVANPFLAPTTRAAIKATLPSAEGIAGICFRVSDVVAGFLIGKHGA